MSGEPCLIRSARISVKRSHTLNEAHPSTELFSDLQDDSSESSLQLRVCIVERFREDRQHTVYFAEKHLRGPR